MPHKLLLADDSVTIQRVIELTFADEDIQVQAVGDGKKAIASIQSERPDIVLADVGMPERDGYEVAAFIKTTSELSHIPVLLLTGAFEPIDEARARAVGCDGVLVKPFEPQMVINRVKDLLAGRRPSAGWSGTSQPAQSARESAPRSNPDEAGAPVPGVPAGSLEDYFDRLDAAFASIEGPAAIPQISPVTHTAPPGSRPPAVPEPPQQVRHVPAPVASTLPEGIAQWDPDLTGDPGKPAPIEPPPIQLDPSRGFVPAQAGPPAPAGAPSPQATAAQPAPPANEARRPAPASQQAEPTPPAAVVVGPPLPTLAEAFAALLSAEQGRSLSAAAAVQPTDELVEDIVQRVILRMADRAVRDTVTDVAERLVREEIARIKSA